MTAPTNAKTCKVSDSSTVATYEYDFRGLRIKKITPTGTTRFHWDHMGRLTRESDPSNNELARYIYDDKDRLVGIVKGGKGYYAHLNYRGDVVSITDESKNVVATYQYDPWGKLLSKTGTLEQPFRYAGYYYDNETELYYLKARYYNPDTSRFLTKDTVDGINANPQTLNLYAYCGGNPVMCVDPDGDFALAIPAAYYGYVAAMGAATWLATPQGKQFVTDRANELGTSVSAVYQQTKALFARGKGKKQENSNKKRPTAEEQQKGTELARKGNQILGNKHNPGRVAKWQKEVGNALRNSSKGVRDAFKNNGGISPRCHN